MHFKGQCGHVVPDQRVAFRVLCYAAGKTAAVACTWGRVAFNRHKIHQVKYLTQRQLKRLVALAHKHTPAGAGGNVHVVDKAVSVSSVITRAAEGFGAGVVERFSERVRTICSIGDSAAGARAAITLDHGQGVGLHVIQATFVVGRNAADVAQHRGYGCAIDVQGNYFPGGQHVIEVELKGQVFAAVAIVVDMNLINGVCVHGEIVGSTIGGLHRNVVGQQGHVIFATRFVANEHVEIRGVYLRQFGNEWCLAVAGSTQAPCRQQQAYAGSLCRAFC